MSKKDNFKLLLNNIEIVEEMHPFMNQDSIIINFGEDNISNNFQINFGDNEQMGTYSYSILISARIILEMPEAKRENYSQKCNTYTGLKTKKFIFNNDNK